MRVIADTMIWYNLGSGHYPPEILKNVELIPTLVSVAEVAFSLNNIDEKKWNVQEAIKAMILYRKNLILESPFHFIANVKTPDDPSINTLLKVTEAIANRFELTDDLKQHHISIRNKFSYNIRKAEAEKWNNDALLQYSAELKKDLLRRNTLEESWLKIIDLVSSQIGKTSQIRKEECELFHKVYDYFRTRVQTKYFVARPNDFNDIFNMAYVKPNEKYWTNEQKWNRIIKDVGCEHYLFTVK